MTIDHQTAEESFLLGLAREGDRDAYGELIRRYRMPVVRVVYRMCGDYSLSEDAAQNAFLQAWQRFDSFLPGSSFRSWIFRIGVNAAIDLLRREKSETPLESAEKISRAEQVEKKVERAEREDYIRRAVLSLPEGCRAAVILREYEGMSYKEIADTLNISIGTVMSRLNYGRTLLAKQLNCLMEDA